MSQFSPKLCKLESSNMIYICRMSDCIVGLRLRVIALIFFLFFIHFSFFPQTTISLLKTTIFHPFFFLSPNYKLTLKIRVGVISGTCKARMLKLCIPMDNELLCSGIENLTPCFYSSLYLSIFLSFMAKFVSQFFSGTVQARIFKCGTNVCRMSDCIMGLRLRVMAFYTPALKKWGYTGLLYSSGSVLPSVLP